MRCPYVLGQLGPGHNHFTAVPPGELAARRVDSGALPHQNHD